MTIRIILLLAFGLALSGCTSLQRGELEPGPIGERYLDQAEVCTAAWRRLVAEWHENGGGLSESIQAVRAQIQADERSELARLIKYSWSLQLRTGYDHTRRAVGSWPVSDDAYREATAFRGRAYPEWSTLPQECQATVWLGNLLRDEMLDSSGHHTARFAEAPEDMAWESPDAQQWVIYWLLVAIR